MCNNLSRSRKNRAKRKDGTLFNVFSSSLLRVRLDFSMTNATNACSYDSSTCYFVDFNGSCLSDSTVHDLILKYVVPTYYEWICIVLYFIIFIVGTIGNLLVIIVIQRNRSMRYVIQ
jgi:hypothetical protein